MCSDIDHLIATKCPITSIERERTVILQQFSDVKQSHNNLSVLLVENDKVFHDWLIKLVSEFSEINHIIDTYVMSTDVLTPKAVNNIQLEKIPLPRFDGDIRLYPRFRHDFVELNDKQASFMLRQCLNKSIVQYFNLCEENVDVLLDERLDERFGDPSKVTDVIINDIKNFTNNGFSEWLIEFIHLIEAGYNDLKAL